MSAPAAVPIGDVLLQHEAAEVAWVAATSAARLVHEDRPADLGVRAKSSAADIVTVMDAMAERRICDIIGRARPADALLGEEGAAGRGTSGYRWVIDPIDGTVNYLHRSPLYGVSVGLEHNGAPVLGVIARPALGDAFIGITGLGSWRVHGHEALPLEMPEPPSLGAVILGANLAYDVDSRSRQARRLAAMAPKVRDLRLFGAATYDLTELARGTIHAYVGENLAPWDLSAATAILRAAGFSIAAHRRSGSDFTVACHPRLESDLVAALDEAIASAGGVG